MATRASWHDARRTPRREADRPPCRQGSIDGLCPARSHPSQHRFHELCRGRAADPDHPGLGPASLKTPLVRDGVDATRRHKAHRAVENIPITHGHLDLRIAIAVESRGDKRSFAFQEPGEPRHPCLVVGGVPTQLGASRYPCVRNRSGAPNWAVVAKGTLDLGPAQRTHQRRENSHHSRSGRAFDRGHKWDLVVGLPRPRRNDRPVEDLCDANDNVTIRHRQSDRRAVWRGRRTGKERTFGLENARKPKDGDRSAIGTSLDRVNRTAMFVLSTGRDTGIGPV